MQLTFMGAAKTVTGSKYLLSIRNKKVLIDCGLYQGYKALRLRNWSPLPVEPSKIDAVILTHAHIDHSGYIPLLIKNGFKGKIYCTHGTKDLCNILLPDSGHLAEEDANRANRYHYSKHKPALPLYTQEDAITALLHFKPLDFHTTYQLFEHFSFEFIPAGHIIGSSMVKISYDDKTLLFTGDLGRPHPLVMNPPASVKKIDYLVIESTYGDRLHDTMHPLDQLAEIIQETIANNGSIIIPAFAVGRAQEVLYLIYTLKKNHRIPDVPIFLDSPMAQDVSDLLMHYSSEHRLNSEQCKAICKSAKYTRSPEESKAIDQYKTPLIVVSASGMAEGGRILHHLKAFLPDDRNTILFTGFQAPDTRGERLLRGESEIKIHGEMIPVRARIESMNNMSAHADSQEILNWLKNIENKPKKVFITHGELEQAKALKMKIEQEFGWVCDIPDYLQVEKLD